MKEHKMQLKLLWVLLIGLVIAACSPTTPVGEAVTAEMADGSVTMTVNAVAQPQSADGATSGALQLNIAFRNNTEQDVTLNLTQQDYVLAAGDGIELTPTTISPELMNLTIPAGASVNGSAEFGVLSPTGTFTLHVTGFDDVTIDARSPS
jgi:hypothetical protein